LEVARGESLEFFTGRFVKSREFAELAVFFDDWERTAIPQAIRKEATALLIQTMSQTFMGQRLDSCPVHDLFSKWHSRINRGDVEFPGWATAQITQFVPFNLLHATELYIDLIRDDFLESDRELVVRQDVVKETRQRLSTLTPDEFATCFPSNFPYALDRLIHIDRRRQYPPPFLANYSDWTWMRSVLLAAAQIHPQSLLPQLIHEFGEYGPTGELFADFKFREKDVLEFFGPDTPKFYALMLEAFTPDPQLDQNFARLLPLARKQAEQWQADSKRNRAS
jgi:hypothetical protein